MKKLLGMLFALSVSANIFAEAEVKKPSSAAMKVGAPKAAKTAEAEHKAATKGLEKAKAKANEAMHHLQKVKEHAQKATEAKKTGDEKNVEMHKKEAEKHHDKAKKAMSEAREDKEKAVAKRQEVAHHDVKDWLRQRWQEAEQGFDLLWGNLLNLSSEVADQTKKGWEYAEEGVGSGLEATKRGFKKIGRGAERWL